MVVCLKLYCLPFLFWSVFGTKDNKGKCENVIRLSRYNKHVVVILDVLSDTQLLLVKDIQTHQRETSGGDHIKLVILFKTHHTYYLIMELYYHPLSPPARAVFSLLKQLNITFTEKQPNALAGDLYKPEYLKVNTIDHQIKLTHLSNIIMIAAQSITHRPNTGRQWFRSF